MESVSTHDSFARTRNLPNLRRRYNYVEQCNLIDKLDITKKARLSSSKINSKFEILENLKEFCQEALSTLSNLTKTNFSLEGMPNNSSQILKQLQRATSEVTPFVLPLNFEYMHGPFTDDNSTHQLDLTPILPASKTDIQPKFDAATLDLQASFNESFQLPPLFEQLACEPGSTSITDLAPKFDEATLDLQSFNVPKSLNLPPSFNQMLIMAIQSQKFNMLFERSILPSQANVSNEESTEEHEPEKQPSSTITCLSMPPDKSSFMKPATRQSSIKLKLTKKDKGVSTLNSLTLEPTLESLEKTAVESPTLQRPQHKRKAQSRKRTLKAPDLKFSTPEKSLESLPSPSASKLSLIKTSSESATQEEIFEYPFTKKSTTAHLISNIEMEVLESFEETGNISQFSNISDLSNTEVFDKTMSPTTKATMNKVKSFVISERFKTQVDNDTISIDINPPVRHQIATKHSVFVLNDESLLQKIQSVKKSWSNFELLHLTHLYHKLHYQYKDALMKEFQENSYLPIKFEEVAHALSFVAQCGNEENLFPHVKLPKNPLFECSEIFCEMEKEKNDKKILLQEEISRLTMPSGENERASFCCQALNSFLDTLDYINFREWKAQQISALIFALCRLFLDKHATVTIQVNIRRKIDKIFDLLEKDLLISTKQHFVAYFPFIEENYWGFKKIFELLSELSPNHSRMGVRCFLALIKMAKSDHQIPEKVVHSTPKREHNVVKDFREIFSHLPIIFEKLIKKPDQLGAIILSLNEVLQPRLLKEFSIDDIQECVLKMKEASRNLKKSERVNDRILSYWEDRITHQLANAIGVKAQESHGIPMPRQKLLFD